MHSRLTALGAFLALAVVQGCSGPPAKKPATEWKEPQEFGILSVTSLAPAATRGRTPARERQDAGEPSTSLPEKRELPDDAKPVGEPTGKELPHDMASAVEFLGSQDWQRAVCELRAFPPVKDETSLECSIVTTQLVRFRDTVRQRSGAGGQVVGLSDDWPGHKVCGLVSKFVACLEAGGWADQQARSRKAMEKFLELANAVRVDVVHSCPDGGILALQGVDASIAPQDTPDPVTLVVNSGICGALNHGPGSQGDTRTEGAGETIIEASLTRGSEIMTFQLTVEVANAEAADATFKVVTPEAFPCAVNWVSIPGSGPAETVVAEYPGCLPWVRGTLTLTPRSSLQTPGQSIESVTADK